MLPAKPLFSLDMRYIVGTCYQSCTIKVTITAKKMCSIHLEACDAVQRYTYYTRRDRMYMAGETESLYIMMPLSGKNTYVDVTETNMGDTGNFTIVSVTKMGLKRQMDVVNMRNPDVKNFCSFGQPFAFNAGVLPTYSDRDYISSKGNFRIHYVPVIADNGRPVITPARIDKQTRIIEASKSKMMEMTVPIRFCILCHEFSHMFLNENMYSELEADINGLIIYLGLGYPRIEAKETFLNILYIAPTDENQQRYEHIVQFIDNFESENFDHL